MFITVKKMEKRKKRAQEEMVGFVVIVVIVMIIIVFFLLFSLSSKPQTKSYEAQSFLQAALQYTTPCEINYQYMSVQNLIFSCYNQQTCSDGTNSCSVLSGTLNYMLNTSWPIGPNFPTKGYKLEISSDSGSIVSINQSNITGTYKGAQQVLPESGISINVLFTAYS